MAVNHEGLLHGIDQLLAMLADGPFAAVVFQQQGEFIAAHPGEIFFAPGVLGHALGGGLEQTVTDFMAQGFVDRFEAVQVDHQQRHLFPVQSCQGQGLVQVFAELGAVGQAGEAVVIGQELQLLFGFLAGCQVGHHADKTDHLFVFVANRTDLQPFRERLAISAGLADFPFPKTGLSQRGGNHLVGVAVGGGFLMIQHLLAQHHGFAVAGNLLEAGIHCQEAELVVEDEDAFRGVVEDGGSQPQLLLALAVFGDIPAGADHAQSAALIRPGHHPSLILDPAPAAIRMAEPIHGMVTVILALEVGHHGAADAGQIFRVNQGFQVAEEILEVGAVVTQQAVEVGVVVAPGIQHPVPQADIAGFQRQFQSFTGGCQGLVGFAQGPGALLHHGFQSLVGLLQALAGFLTLVDFLSQLLVEGFRIAAGPVQVVDQRPVAGLQHHGLVAGLVDAAGGEQEEQSQQGHQQHQRELAMGLGLRQSQHAGAEQHQQIQENGGKVAAVGGQSHGAQAQPQAGNGELGGQHVAGEQGIQGIEQVTGGAQDQWGAQGDGRKNATAVWGGQIVAQAPMAEGQGDQLADLDGSYQSQPDQQVLPGNGGAPVGPYQRDGTGYFQQHQHRNATE